MSIFNNNAGNVNTVDKKSPEYAVNQFNMARGNLLIAIVFTVVNVVLALINTNTYFLFSISFPYYMFDTSSIIFGVVLPIIVLAFYLCCYIFSKKKPGFMIAALVAFCLDCIFLVGFSALIIFVSDGEMSVVDFIIDYLAHIWVLVYLIIGVRYCRRYKAAINSPSEPLQIGAIEEAEPVSVDVSEDESINEAE